MVLPVNVYGTDSVGKPFHLIAYTMDISTGGARLAGISVHLSVGDLIAVRYKQAKARFRVAWVSKDQLGIQYAPNEKFIWVELPEDGGFADTVLIEEAEVAPTGPVPLQNASASSAPPETHGEKERSAGIATALEICLDGLRRLDGLVGSAELGRHVARHFHRAVAHFRNTAWAVQQGTELQQDGKDCSVIVETANSEHVRYAAQLCRELAQNRHDLGPGVSEENRQILAGAVLALAGFLGIASHGTIPRQRPAATPDDLTALLAGLDDQIRSSSLPPQAALELIAERGRSFTGADGAAIALRDEEDLVCCASAGMAPAIGVRFSASEGLAMEAVAAVAPVLCADTEIDPRVDKSLCRTLNLRSSAIVPLTDRESVLGILQVFSCRPGFFDEPCLAVLRQLGQFAAALQADAQMFAGGQAGDLC
jgi:GAF domain-containing protein